MKPLDLLIYALICIVVLWLIWWLSTMLLPHPFGVVITVVVGIVMLIWLVRGNKLV